MKKVTAAWLREHEACAADIDEFEAEWPKGCLPTEENLLRATELNLDADWFAWNWLTEEKYAEYLRIVAPAHAEYVRIRDAAYAEYKAKRAPILARIIKED